MIKADYLAGVQLLMAQRPDHLLLETLKGGFSPLNVIYMKRALKDLPQPKVIEEVEIKKEDTALHQVMIDKKSLFGRRAKLSNTFHSCSSDADRANVSDDIQQVQRQIEGTLSSISFYKKNGTMPAKEEDTQINLSGIELIKRRNSLRSNISIKKRQIENYFRLPEGHKDRDKISDLEEKLKTLQTQKHNVEISINKQIV